MRIELGHLPDRRLNPNKRHHWSVVAKAKRNARDLATALILEQGKPATPYAKAKISILFIASDKRKRDVDNLFASMKPYVDGLVGGKLIEDDSAMHVTYELNYMRGKEENTIIEIEEL